MFTTSQAFKDHSKCGGFGYLTAFMFAIATFFLTEYLLRTMASAGTTELASLYGACASNAMMTFFGFACFFDGRTLAGTIKVIRPYLPVSFFLIIAFFAQI